MKIFGLILCAGAAVLLTAYAAELLEVTTKKQNFPEKHLSTERTYRGSQCIIFEMTKGGKKSRVFSVNGKAVMVEEDEDNNGFFESFMIFDTAAEDFEWFTRATNGVVHPIASEKLQDVKSKKKIADKKLSELINESLQDK